MLVAIGISKKIHTYWQQWVESLNIQPLRINRLFASTFKHFVDGVSLLIMTKSYNFMIDAKGWFGQSVKNINKYMKT